MRHQPNRPTPPPHQRGAALVIALIILLVLTVMGVSGIRNATLGEAMAFNTQVKSITFQAAETAIGGVIINQGSVLNQAVGAGVGAPPVANDYSAMANPPGQPQSVAATVTTAYIGWEYAPGYSLKESGGFAQFNFDISGSGAMATASALSIHRFGAAKIGPKAGAE